MSEVIGERLTSKRTSVNSRLNGLLDGRMSEQHKQNPEMQVDQGDIRGDVLRLFGLFRSVHWRDYRKL